MVDIVTLIRRAKRRRENSLQLNGFPDRELPDEIGDLTHLVHLHISGCPNLVSLPNSVGRLTNLQSLSILNGSALQELPESLGSLVRLRSLRLRGTPLRFLPSSLSSLKSLRELSISGSRIRTLPAGMDRLSELRELRIVGSWINTLPNELTALASLESLVMRGNFLAALPASVSNLDRLRVLDVAHNRLNSLPEGAKALSRLDVLDLTGNPRLELPPEILASEPAGILDFYFRSSRRRQLNEAKLLLVGQGGVGKTSLVNRLIDDQFDEREQKTDGIKIRAWPLGGPAPIRVNVWDFGGQEIMHSTHQFFLTKRSVYILVLDARAGERESNLHYWLEMISLYGVDSPVLVVLNKSEDHFDHIDENRLRLDYAGSINFVGFYNISCKTRSGIAMLREDIERTIRSVPHVSDMLPEDYFQVKSELEAKSETRDFITQTEFEDTCSRHGVVDADEQRRLLRFLHDLGSVLHYDDPDQKYNVYDTRVLNPEWVTSGVYKILNDPLLLREGTGVLNKSDLARMLDRNRYPEHRYPFLIDMMRKYELCLEFPDHPARLLVPELLSKNEPDVGWGKPSDVLNFEYHYGVLPRGLVPRFIVRTQHLLTSQATVWRSGAVLVVEDCRVLVRGDVRKSKVFVQVQGEKLNRRRALAVVRDTFASVHLGYGDLNAEAKVPLPRDPAAPPVDYHYLLKLEREGVAQTYFEKAQQPYSVRELLDGVDIKKFDAFLSHTSADKPAVRDLAKRLLKYGVRYWLDEEHLTPGRPWQPELASAIRDCQTVVVLVGPQGIGPWADEEATVALDLAARGQKMLMPVLLPGAPDRDRLPGHFAFLASRTWIDFRSGIDEPSVERMARAIRES
jgi:internalin A